MKWNKKICIQYLKEMRSPIEEEANMGGQPGGDGRGNMIEAFMQSAKVRQAMTVQPESITEEIEPQ